MQNGLDSVSHGSLDPVDWRSVRAQGHRMLDDIFDYAENICERPVWQPISDSVRARFHEGLPAAPADLEAVHASFMR
jgi:aromatic-L-amino-acid/L-tryptophan decarboxylase